MAATLKNCAGLRLAVPDGACRELVIFRPGPGDMQTDFWADPFGFCSEAGKKLLYLPLIESSEFFLFKTFSCSVAIGSRRQGKAIRP